MIVTERFSKHTRSSVTGAAVPEDARSSGYYHEVASDLKDFLTGVENVSKLLIRTADRCKSEELKQVWSIFFPQRSTLPK